MTLTMTRTRTQTTLMKLAEMVANVHGEIAFLEGMLAQAGIGAVGGASVPRGVTPQVRVRLDARRLKLVADRNALYATVRQFDPSLDPERIGALEGWTRRFGTRGLGTMELERRYVLAQGC